MDSAHVESVDIVFIGDGNIGKTSIIGKYLDSKYNLNLIVHTSSFFVHKTDKSICGIQFKLCICDTPGEESDDSFDKYTSTYYRSADAAIICYDVTNKESFLNVNQWFEKIRNYNDDCNVVLVGNKSDLVKDRTVSKKEAQVS